MIKHVLIDVINWNSDVYRRVESALSECVLMYMSSGDEHDQISLYKCRQVFITIYKTRGGGLIDILGNNEEVVYRVLSVLPREKILIRFIERGYDTSV